MKRLIWTPLCVMALAACVESSCPEGSTEVSSNCQSLGSPEDDDASTSQDGGDPDGGGLQSDGSTGEIQDGAVSNSGDATTVDPCGVLGCGNHAHCADVEDDARCVCDEGYEGDGTTCEADPCASDPCDADTSTCKNEEGEAVCECRDGFARCDADPYACTTDLQSDAAHCGACDAACAGNLACTDGACEQPITQLSLGLEHSCALAPDGEILCWGSDEYLQLQHADPRTADHEPGATTLGKARALSTGVATNCALMQNDDLVCWGSNDPFNWLAPGDQQGVFTIGQGYFNVESIHVGNLAVCIVIAGGAECWGITASFDAGASVLQYTFSERKRIELPDSIFQLSTGYHTCAVTSDRRAYCWGYDTASAEVIEDATGPLMDVEQVSVASFTGPTCAVLADGRIMCWGANNVGQLGNVGASAGPVTQAVPVTDASGSALRDFVQVAVGPDHGCGRKQDGTVMCWGQSNRLGNAATSSAAQPYASEVRGIDDAIDLAAGASHTCVRRQSGQAQCWGDNNRGQLGVATLQIGGVASSAVPVNVVGLP